MDGLEHLVQMIPDIVYRLNPHGRITFINNAVRGLGYEPEELTGKHFRVMVHPEDFARCGRQAALRGLRGIEIGWQEAPRLFDERRAGVRMTRDLELRLLCKGQFPEEGAQYRLGEIISTGTHDEAGLFSGTVGIIRDVTGRREAREALLEREDQLREAQKKEAIGLLAAGVSHEINNALTGILGNAMLIQLGEADAGAIDVVIAEARRAAKVVQDLMTFARPAAANLQPVGVREMVERVLRIVGNDLAIHKVTVDDRVPCQIGAIQADADQLQQVLLNLLLNARDAMPGGGRITLDACSAEGGRAVELTVRDTGQGIPPELLPRVFHPFCSSKPAGQGTGLGLSVAHGIVEAHGGQIELANHPEGGALATLRQPAARPGGSTTRRRLVQMLVRLSSLDILVVDDEQPVRRFVRRLLEQEGNQVECAGSVDAALELLEGRSFDLVICDLALPGRDGMQLHQALVDQGRREATRFLLITGLVGGFELPVPVLLKPFDARGLFDALDPLLPAEQ